MNADDDPFDVHEATFGADDVAVPFELFTDERHLPGVAHLEPVRVGPKSDLVILAPSVRRRVTSEGLREGRALVQVEHTLRLNDGFPGRYELTAFAIYDADGATLSPDVIRSLPLAEVCARSMTGFFKESLGRILRLGGPDRSLTVAVGLDDVKPSDEERICLAYTVAKLVGRDTNRVVAKHADITPGAAAQRIRRLRQQEKLPPAEGQGKRR